MKKITKPFYFVIFFYFDDPSLCWFFIYLIFNDFIWITNNWFLKEKNFNFLTCFFFFFLYVVLMSWESCTTVDFCDCVFIHIYIYCQQIFIVITNGLYCLITSGQIMVPPKRIYPQICPQHREFINTFHQKIQKTANHFL